MNNKISMGQAVGALAVIIASIVIGIKCGFGTIMALFLGTMMSVVMAMVYGTKWVDIQKATMENLASGGLCLFVLVLIGVLVGVWLIGGTLPSLIYYGLELVSPKALVPLTFVLCAMTSVFTGTSFGSVATMGLAMYGIGINMGIPGEVIAGAVVSGAYFGDKMSPMSDTTNVAPANAGTDLYSHIGSMCYTTVPATIVCLILYVFVGMGYASTSYDPTNVELMRTTLASKFQLSPVCLIPLFMVLILSAMKVPAMLGMGSTAVVSVIFAAMTQHIPVAKIMGAAMVGYTSNTGVKMVDAILTRGGIRSMAGTFAIILFATVMGGALKSSGIMDAFANVLMKVVKSSRSLIIATLCYSWGIILLTGNQMLSLIMPASTMGDLYDKMDVDRKVLSRCVEDAGTLSSAICPWAVASAFVTGVLGVGIGYIPYAFLCYIVPIFSIICAYTNIGVWNSKGEKMWGKKN